MLKLPVVEPRAILPVLLPDLEKLIISLLDDDDVTSAPTLNQKDIQFVSVVKPSLRAAGSVICELLPLNRADLCVIPPAFQFHDA